MNLSGGDAWRATIKVFSSAFTVPRLEALEAAIAEGVLRVKYSDKEVQYRSLAEMLQVRDIMRRALGLKKMRSFEGFLVAHVFG